MPTIPLAFFRILRRILLRAVEVALALPRLARDNITIDHIEWAAFFGALAIVAASACTPAARATAGAVVADVAAVAGSAVPCAIIHGAAPGVSATACSAVSTDLSDVAKLVADILGSLPPAMNGADVGPPVMIRMRARSGGDVAVTLPQGAAALVRAEAERRAGDGGAR